MWPNKKLHWPTRNLHCSSYFSSFSSILVLSIFVPLVIITLIACTLGDGRSLTQISPSWTVKSVSFLGTYSLNSFTEVHDHNYMGFDNGGEALAPETSSNLAMDASLFHEDIVAEASAVDGGVVKKHCSKFERLELGLTKARLSIKEAAKNGRMISIYEDLDYVPRGPIYKNANAFHRSYLEMETLFKIYVYEEGKPPMFHSGPCKSIYSTEGRFIHEMERGNLYRTYDPEEAHVYFLPFSVVVMVHYLYEPRTRDMQIIGRTVADYIDVVSARHPFWNRSLGADHFMLSCHDWGPYSTTFNPYLFNNSIRVLCNANTSEGFNPSKDVTLPEINLKTGEITGLVGGPSPSRRSILAFFAGGLHGEIRHHLLQHWKGKDQDVVVYDTLPGDLSYDLMMKKTKYCLCPSGYEVASPRIVEAIYRECVPVLISDGYVPPFSDVLNWKAFSVSVQVRDIPNIKKILMGISQTQYLRMHRRVKQVQRHFLINGSPKRFDLFHMIVHSIWLRRLNIRIQDR